MNAKLSSWPTSCDPLGFLWLQSLSKSSFFITQLHLTTSVFESFE